MKDKKDNPVEIIVNNSNQLDWEKIKCVKCGCELFIQGFLINQLSKFKLSNTSKEMTGKARDINRHMPVGFVCYACGYPVNAKDETKEVINKVAQQIINGN